MTATLLSEARPSRHPRGRAARAAAKFAPGRVRSRLYTRTRNLSAILDEVEVSLNDAPLDASAKTIVHAALNRHGRALTVLREQVGAAASTRRAGDQVKDDLKDLANLIEPLAPAVRALVRASRALASAPVTSSDMVTHALLHAGVADLLDAVATDQHPGVLVATHDVTDILAGR